MQTQLHMCWRWLLFYSLEYTVKFLCQSDTMELSNVLQCCKHAMQFTLGLLCRAKRRCVDDGHMHGDGEDTLLIQQSQEIQPFRTEQFKILVKTGCTDLWNIFTISVTSDAVGQA